VLERSILVLMKHKCGKCAKSETSRTSLQWILSITRLW